jgi:hypothetical protein
LVDKNTAGPPTPAGPIRVNERVVQTSEGTARAEPLALLTLRTLEYATTAAVFAVCAIVLCSETFTPFS